MIAFFYGFNNKSIVKSDTTAKVVLSWDSIFKNSWELGAPPAAALKAEKTLELLCGAVYAV